MFPDNQKPTVDIQEVAITSHSDQMSCEDHASDILRCHYGTLSESLHYPIGVAQLLYEDEVISKMKLAFVKYTAECLSMEKAVYLLLQSVRHAIHTNYHNLEVFASVLLKFTSSVPCANSILKDCGKYNIL